MAPINVIVVHPQCPPRELRIDGGDYRQLQALVGGMIEVAAHLAPDLDVLCNEEGLLNGLPPNVASKGGVLLVGTLIVARVDDEGDLVDTTWDDLMVVCQWLDSCSRPARFEYDIPSPRMFTGPDAFEQAEKAGALPAPTIAAIHDVRGLP